MREIPLNKIPNQRLRVTLDGNNWEITIKAARRVMCCDIKCNDHVLCVGLRAMPNQPLIPYRYMRIFGNLAFVTDNDQLPWWEEFNVTQRLVHWRDGND